jgi:ADP-ribose pyrophosphatase
VKRERTLQTERIYDGKLVSLRIDTVELPSGRETRREIVEHGDVVAMVPVDSEDNVLLVRQYRKATEQTLLEIPAGLIEAGEEPLESARRELEEETGFAAESWELLGGFYTSPGFCTEYIYVYLATRLRPSSRDPDDDEIIELVRVPLSRAADLVASGEICDAKSMAGLLMALRRLGT